MNGLSEVVGRLPRNRALHVAFVGITLVLSLLTWLGSAGLHNKLNELERNTTERESMLQCGEELHASSLQLKEQLLSAKTTLKTLQAKLPDTPEESQFLQELSELAISTGVSLGDFRPGGSSQRPNCKEIELRLRSTGRYANVCRWLDGLGNLKRLVRISSISIAGPAMAGSDCIIDIQLNLLFGVSGQPPLTALVKP